MRGDWGLSLPHLQWKAGTGKPSLAQVINASRRLDVPLDYFLKDEVPPSLRKGISPAVAEMMEGLEDLGDTLRQVESLEERLTVQTLKLDLEHASPTEAKTSGGCDLLGLSQPLFAQLLGDQTRATIAYWERDTRPMTGMVCRFLEEMDAIPPTGKNGSSSGR